MIFEHAIHQTVLGFRLIRLRAHECTRAVRTTFSSTLEILSADFVAEALKDFTHAVSGNASDVPYSIADPVIDVINNF